jgi:hypothetical protein
MATGSHPPKMRWFERRSVTMVNHQDFNHLVRRTAMLTVALAACLIFGIIVLAGGDWLPGGIIVGASTVGLAREIPIIRSLCSTGEPASPPKHKVIKK